MNLSNNAVERICQIYRYLDVLEKKDISFVSSQDIAEELGTTAYTIRKDISLLGVTGFTRKGYEVSDLKNQLRGKLNLNKHRKACIVGLGRLGTAILDYEAFQDDGFDIVAGFDSSINKLERIRSAIDVFPLSELSDIVQSRGIELGIVTVPRESAQGIADMLALAGIRGILNFAPVRLSLPEEVVYRDMDVTNALRFIAAKFEK